MEHHRLCRTGVNPLADLATLGDLARRLLRLKRRAVITVQHKPNVYGLLPAALAGVPVRWAVVEGLWSLPSLRGRKALGSGRYAGCWP